MSIELRNRWLKVENAAGVATMQTGMISMKDFAATVLSDLD